VEAAVRARTWWWSTRLGPTSDYPAGERRRINFTLSVDEATAILSVVQSEDTLAMYVEERGWSTEQRREWTTRTLQRRLLPVLS
jgi:hypothetical protein